MSELVEKEFRFLFPSSSVSAVQCKCSPTPLSLTKHNREFGEAVSFAEGTESLAVSTDKYIMQNHADKLCWTTIR